MDENAIHYKRHSFFDGYYGSDSSSEYDDSSEDDSSEDSSDDDYPYHGVPIYREMADPNSPHHEAYRKYMQY